MNKVYLIGLPASGKTTTAKWLAEKMGWNNLDLDDVLENETGMTVSQYFSEYGEDRIPGMFISEPGKNRRGFTTTHKSKLAACTKLKYYIESGKMSLSSKNLVAEIKTFVAHGPSFAAKEGETDDLVMATILAVRLIEYLMKYDEATWNHLVERGSDDYVTPMPIGML